MRRFAIGVGILVGLLLVTAGCEQPVPAKPVTQKYSEYDSALPRKHGSATEDIADGHETTTSIVEAPVDNIDQPTRSQGAVTPERIEDQRAPQPDRIISNNEVLQKGGDGYRPDNVGVISGGTSTVGASTKSASSGSLSATSTE